MGACWLTPSIMPVLKSLHHHPSSSTLSTHHTQTRTVVFVSSQVGDIVVGEGGESAPQAVTCHVPPLVLLHYVSRVPTTLAFARSAAAATAAAAVSEAGVSHASTHASLLLVGLRYVHACGRFARCWLLGFITSSGMGCPRLLLPPCHVCPHTMYDTRCQAHHVCFACGWCCMCMCNDSSRGGKSLLLHPARLPAGRSRRRTRKCGHAAEGCCQGVGQAAR